MRNADIKLKNRKGEEVTYLEVSKVQFETPTEDKVTFSYGDMVSGNITLDFSQGNQEVSSADNELYNHVIIQKPSTFIPENIAEGVEIAGLLGTFQGAGEKPKLRTPTITRSGDLITITNPSTNGTYVEKYLIYVSGILTKEQTTTTFSVASFDLQGNINFAVSLFAKGFEESDKSTTIAVITYAIHFVLDEIASTNAAKLITQNLTFATVLSASNNKFIPEDIEVTMGGQACDYLWNSYTGDLSVSNVTGDIQVNAIADDVFQIRRPKIAWNGDNLNVTPERYARFTKIYINGIEVYEIESFFEYKIEDVSGSTYVFRENKDGYYESNNKAKQNSYAMCKVTFSSIGEKDIYLRCINYAEANYDFGIISNINMTLSLSYTDDGTGSNVFKNFKGLSSATPVLLKITIPAGVSFIYVKYRKDGSVDSYNDTFQFKIEEE